MSTLTLYSYWRSSAAYRVRIALNLKQLPYTLVPVNIAPGVSEQLAPEHQARNPQGLVPVLADGERMLRQSLAIIEYLEEAYPGPALLPAGARDRARARAIAQLIACEMQPLQNLRVFRRLEAQFGADDAARTEWVRYWIADGLASLEALVADNHATGAFCEGDVPTLADICLVPQCYAARRFNVDFGAYPTIARIDAAARALKAFADAAPEAQPDAPQS